MQLRRSSEDAHFSNQQLGQSLHLGDQTKRFKIRREAGAHLRHFDKTNKTIGFINGGTKKTVAEKVQSKKETG